MNEPARDPIAVTRHRAFGAEMAADHFKKFPRATFTVDGLLAVMREAMGPVAGDYGIGSRGLEPLARTAAGGFLRQWRKLVRAAATKPN
jgi:hypothetical protein